MQQFPFSKKARVAGKQPIGYLMAKGVAADMISLAAGLVDGATLPVDEVDSILHDFMKDRGRAALQYGTTEGFAGLRSKVLTRLAATDGARASQIGAGRVIISTGSQQMLYILTEVMVDPGDIVITASPSYFVYLGALEMAGARVVGIPADRDGMRIDLLGETLRRLVSQGESGRIKIIYMTTYFDNPSGTSLAVERRKALVETVKSIEGMRPLIIEDAAYRELRFSGPDTPSVWSFDESKDRVAYLGTFSKPFSPGLRVGYAVLPEELVEKVTIIKCGHDFGSSNFTQMLTDFAVERGVYDRHIDLLRKTYAAKCAQMCECLTRELGAAASWQKPEGGLYCWVDLGGIDTGMEGDFFERCCDEGVLYVPGEICYPDKSAAPRGKARLSFGPTSGEDIEEGIARLGAVLSRAAGQRG